MLHLLLIIRSDVYRYVHDAWEKEKRNLIRCDRKQVMKWRLVRFTSLNQCEIEKSARWGGGTCMSMCMCVKDLYLPYLTCVRRGERESERARINHPISSRARWEKIRTTLISSVSGSMRTLRNGERRNWKLLLFSSSLIFYSVNTSLLMNLFFFFFFFLSDLNAMRWRRSNERERERENEGGREKERKNNDWDCASVWKDHERRWEDAIRVFSFFPRRSCVQLTEKRRDDDEHQE